MNDSPLPPEQVDRVIELFEQPEEAVFSFLNSYDSLMEDLLPPQRLFAAYDLGCAALDVIEEFGGDFTDFRWQARLASAAQRQMKKANQPIEQQRRALAYRLNNPLH